MLISNQIYKIKLNSKHVKYYKEAGYNIPTKESEWKCKGVVYDFSKEIYVKLEDLPKNSKIQVDVICDVCSKFFQRVYQSYNACHTDGSDYCLECSKIKRKQTCINKYGVDCTTKLDIVKEKIAKTNIERYGGTTPISSKEVKNKIKNTNLKRYGCEYGLSSKEVQDKKEKTNIEKYGYITPLCNEEIKEKIKKTTYNKYGVENISQLDETQEKVKMTNIKNTGYPFVLQNKEIYNKLINTNIEKYGVEYYSQTEECKTKTKNTCLERYGYEYTTLVPEIQFKMINSMIKNGNVPTSSQQIELYNIIKSQYSDAILNYPCDNSIFDIAILLDNDIKIDIEYDGWYWHQDKHKDFRRDMHFKSNGWKVLRIRSGNLLPSETDLFETINYLINTKHTFKEIILGDWREEVAT
jgi:uncharacterized membrane protein